MTFCIFIDTWHRSIFISVFRCLKFVEWCPPSQTPTQNLKIWFSMFGSQEIGSALVSFQMIFEALQSELLRFTFQSMISKILTYMFQWFQLNPCNLNPRNFTGIQPKQKETRNFKYSIWNQPWTKRYSKSQYSHLKFSKSAVKYGSKETTNQFRIDY